jgi:hypothetical protein
MSIFIIFHHRRAQSLFGRSLVCWTINSFLDKTRLHSFQSDSIGSSSSRLSVRSSYELPCPDHQPSRLGLSCVVLVFSFISGIRGKSKSKAPILRVATRSLQLGHSGRCLVRSDPRGFVWFLPSPGLDNVQKAYYSHTHMQTQKLGEKNKK